MNIFVIFVSFVLIFSYSLAVPRTKHKHIKVPLSNLENSKYQETNGLTALQILEENLLNQNINHLNERSFSPKPTFSSCFAAFGEKSPLCHPRRNRKLFNKKHISKRYIKRQLFPMKHVLGPTSNPITDPSSVVEDFFSVFLTNSSSVDPITHTMKKQTTPLSKSENSKFFSITSNLPKSPISITDKFKPSFETPDGGPLPRDKIRLQGRFVASLENRSRFCPVGEILPHNRSSRSHDNKSEMMRLKRVGDSSQSVNRFFKGDNEFEGEDNVEHAPATFEIFTESSPITESTSMPGEHNHVIEMLPEESHLVETTTVPGDHKSVFKMFMEGSHSSPEDNDSGLETITDITPSPEEHHAWTPPELITSSNVHSVANEISGSEHSSHLNILHDNISQSPAMDKSTCESFYKTSCVCSFIGLEKDFRDIFHNAANPKTLYHEISQIQCKQYVPKPDTYQLTSQLKPKVLSANRKPMTVDKESGPKEIEPLSLDQFIRESSSVDDDVLFVFVNTDVSIPCFPTNDVHLSTSDADHVTYKWTRSNKPITDGRMLENGDGEGTLYIEDTSLTDSATYTCEVDYINPDTGQHTEDSFTHNVSVVTLPIVTVRVSMHYRAAAACDASLLEEFQLYLPQLVEQALCKGGGSQRLCSVEVHSPVCHTNGNPDSERSHREAPKNFSTKPLTSWLQDKIEGAFKIGVTDAVNATSLRQKREDSMEMSLNIEVYVHRSAEKDLSTANTTLCDATCHLLITFKLLQAFKESLREIVFIPVTSVTDKGTTVFTPVETSVGVKYIFGCIGGYHLNKGFCSACPKHTFSEDGATECSLCPPHTYQGAVGARKCIPCAHAWTPACNEYFEDVNYVIIVIVVALVAALLAAFILWYLLFVRKKNLAEMGRKFVPKSPGTKRKVKVGKSQKRVRRHDVPMVEISQSTVSVDELEDLINSSPDETDDTGGKQVGKKGSQRRSRR